MTDDLIFRLRRMRAAGQRQSRAQREYERSATALMLDAALEIEALERQAAQRRRFIRNTLASVESQRARLAQHSREAV